MQNPPSTEDSIYAVIDLGYIYILMENEGEKAGYTGSMPQYKPQSFAEFADKRKELLGLLPLDGKKKPQEELPPDDISGKLLQNTPNPFRNSTEIHFKLSKSSDIKIKVYDLSGKQIKEISESRVPHGMNKITLDTAGLAPGIYHYSLDVDGRRTDTKKMVIM